MERGGRLRSESRSDSLGRWAVGRVHLGVLQPAPQLAHDSSVHVVFHGDLDNAAELQTTLVALRVPPVSGAAATIAALYQIKGSKAAADLKGSFCAAIVDNEAGQIVLITDRLGSYPLYRFHLADRFVLRRASRRVARASASVAEPAGGRRPAEVRQFPMGDKTLASASISSGGINRHVHGGDRRRHNREVHIARRPLPAERHRRSRLLRVDQGGVLPVDEPRDGGRPSVRTVALRRTRHARHAQRPRSAAVPALDVHAGRPGMRGRSDRR